MKMYRHAKIGLFIGLLLFNALSACVSTRQVLGSDDICNEGVLDSTCSLGNSSISSSKSSSTSASSNSSTNSSTISLAKPLCCTWLIGMTMSSVILFALFGLLYLAGYAMEKLNNDHGLFDSKLAMPSNMLPIGYSNMPPSKAAPIIQQIQSGQSRWDYELDRNSTIPATETKPVLNKHPIGRPRFYKEHYRNKALRYARLLKHPIGRPRFYKEHYRNKALRHARLLKHPMHLSNPILKDLAEDGFSRERIQYWLSQGLNIDAVDKLGNSMLIHAADCNNPLAIQVMIDYGANVNAQNMHGCTAPMAAILAPKDNEYHETQDTIQAFLDHEADPCIENNQGDTLQGVIQYLPKEEQNEVNKKFALVKQCSRKRQAS